MTSNLSQMSVRLANFFQTKCCIQFLEQNTAADDGAKILSILTPSNERVTRCVASDLLSVIQSIVTNVTLRFHFHFDDEIENEIPILEYDRKRYSWV